MHQLSTIIQAVAAAQNESDLGHNWLTKIIDNADPDGILERRWELKNQNGRKDLSLIRNGREVCTIELKSPKNRDSLINHFRQSHRYAFSQNYWRNKVLVPVLGILTDGNEAIIFDGYQSYRDSLQSCDKWRLTSENTEKLINLITKLAKGEKSHRNQSEIKYDSRTNAKDIVGELTEELLKFYNYFSESKLENPLDSMLQIFVVAVLRDCGFIPTSKMRKIYEKRDWSVLTDLLNSMLGSNFIELPKNKPEVIETVYQETQTLCACLNRVPPDCLGMVYEKVLHKLNLNSDATTSYYTPYELAYSVVKEISPTKENTILDPSCGSGTFLTTVIDFIANNDDEFKSEDNLFNFASKKIRGIDRDLNACNVAKAMILASIASHLSFDPANRELILPTMKDTIIHSDLFLFKPLKKFDVVIGNLPWGHVDGKRKEQIYSNTLRERVDPSSFNSFYRNVDVSSIALEKILINFLDGKGKLGLLIKQQSLYGDGSKKFMSFARLNRLNFWDFGERRFFENPASLTAIAWKNLNFKDFILKKYELTISIAENGSYLKEFGKFFQGFQSSSDHIYFQYAEKFPKSLFNRPVYPGLRASKHYFLPTLTKKIALIVAGSDAPKDFIIKLTNQEKKILENRAQVAKKYPYSWRGCEGIEKYKFDGNQKRIVFPRNFTSGESLTAMLDINGKGIPITSHTVFIPNNETEDWTLFSILAWLNSIHLVPELKEANVTKLAGGFGMYPKNMERIRIPKELLSVEFGNLVKDKFLNNTLDRHEIDSLILEIIERSRRSLG